MLEEFAAKEHRSLGNLCFVLLTWATEQLQKAGFDYGDISIAHASVSALSTWEAACRTCPRLSVRTWASPFPNWMQSNAPQPPSTPIPRQPTHPIPPPSL